MDELNSEASIDYTRLQNLLQTRQWQTADQETRDILINLHGGYRTPFKFDDFPCTDLLTLDRLWLAYSDGRFGLSVQKRIWESVNQSELDKRKAMIWFVEQVGWKQQGAHSEAALVYSDLIQRLRANYPSTLFGSLPARLPFEIVGYGSEGADLGLASVRDQYLPSLVARLTECKSNSTNPV